MMHSPWFPSRCFGTSPASTNRTNIIRMRFCRLQCCIAAYMPDEVTVSYWPSFGAFLAQMAQAASTGNSAPAAATYNWLVGREGRTAGASMVALPASLPYSATEIMCIASSS